MILPVAGRNGTHARKPMARSHGSSKPSFIFSAGCLFILLVTAVQVWRTREPLGAPDVARLPIIQFEAPQRSYGAEIRAEVVLSGLEFAAESAVPSPPVATRIQLDGPLDIEPSINLDSPPIQALDTAGAFEEPLVMSDISIIPLFADTQVPTLPPPRPEPRVIEGIRPAMVGTPANLAQPQRIEGALAPAPALPDKKKKPVVRRVPDRILRKQKVVSQAKSTAFAHPNRLLASIRELSDSRSKTWVQQVEASVQQLLKSPTISAAEAAMALDQLRGLQRRAIDIAASTEDRSEQARVLAASYALEKRLVTYDAIRRAMHPQISIAIEKFPHQPEFLRMGQSVANVRRALGSGAAADQWTEFLLLDDLDGLAESNQPEHQADRLETATRVLERLATQRTTPDQARVLESPVINQLERDLRYWVTVPIDYQRLVRNIEKYEANPSAPVGEMLARNVSQLRWSLIPQHNYISRVLDSHYRNANLRLTMTDDFMNRLLPVIQDNHTPVREEILGAKVFGKSATWTRIGISLVPDPARIHLQLHANGFVSADTRAFKGPVVAFNRDRSEFYLRKPIVIDGDGISIGRSNAVATGSSNLLGLKTRFDRYPLLGSIVRRAAKKEIFEQRYLTRRIIDRRVANSAETQVDRQVTHQLAKTRERLEEKILDPLRKMSLNPETINLETTSERIVFRGRLSGSHQLAAYTARPRALANNLFSFQLHESTVNNVLQQMQLDGKQGDLRQLLTNLVAHVKSLNLEIPEEVPENVHIELANEDALRVYFDKGHVRFTLRIAELSTARREWNNFAVSVNYTPHQRGFQIELGREGVIELSGRRLNLRDQIALRGIFGKVFSKNRMMSVVHPSLATDERLNDLEFSQVVFREGWLGISVDDDKTRIARSQVEPGRSIR